MTAWLLISDRFLPQIHSASLTVRQPLEVIRNTKTVGNNSSSSHCPHEYLEAQCYCGDPLGQSESAPPSKQSSDDSPHKELKTKYKVVTVMLPNCQGQKLNFMTERHNSHWFIFSLSCKWQFQDYSMIISAIVGWRGFFVCLFYFFTYRGMSFLNQIRPVIF